MKILTIIIHAGIEQQIADLLRGLNEIAGFTFTRVEGHGVHDEHDFRLSPRDRVIGYTPHVRVDILMNEEQVDAVLAALHDSRSGLAGKGRYWITAAEREGQL